MRWLLSLLGSRGPTVRLDSSRRTSVRVAGTLAIQVYHEVTGEFIHERVVKIPEYRGVFPGDKLCVTYDIHENFLD